MSRVRAFLLYAGLVGLAVMLAGIGFHTAERGIRALVGTGGPPQTIHVETGGQTIEVTVFGKQVTQPVPTLGDRWSRRLEATKSEWGEAVNEAGFEIGRLLRQAARRLIEWVASLIANLIL